MPHFPLVLPIFRTFNNNLQGIIGNIVIYHHNNIIFWNVMVMYHLIRVTCICLKWKIFCMLSSKIESALQKVYNVLQAKKSRTFYGRSRLEMFCEKGALKTFAKFTRKHLCQKSTHKSSFEQNQLGTPK